MGEMVSIIIPAFNQLDYCRQCVNSVLSYTRPPFKLILVDNGSTDGVGEFFDSVPDAMAIHSETNLGFAGGVNLGLAHAEGHVLLLNSDTLTPRGWLERMVGPFERESNIGMVGAMSNCVSGSQQIDGLDFSSMEEVNAFADELAAKNEGVVRDVSRLVGFCLLIRDRVFEQIGLFDESFGIGNFEDDDYCLRVLRAGYRLCVAEDAFVFHYGSRTFAGMGISAEAWQSLMAENERIFHEKWQARAEERSDAAQYSRQLNRQARDAYDRRDLPQAIALLRKAIAAFPLLDTNYNDLGAVCWEMEQYDKAFDLFCQAVRVNPQSEEARANLQDAATALGRHEDVKALLNE